MNTKMNVLIIGASGQLGSALIKLFPREEVAGTYCGNSQPDLINLDITKADEVNEVLSRLKPAVVIHTAAMTHVDKCEGLPKRAEAINVVGTKNLFNACEAIGAKLVFISTYSVFDGKKGYYAEGDAVNPLNHYSLTKVAAEKIVLQNDNNLVIRPSKIYSYGEDQRNFVARLVTSLLEGKEFPVSNDQFNNPISSEDLAIGTKKLLDTGAFGIYHVGGSDYVSNYSFAMAVAEVFDLPKSLLLSKSSEELNAPAPRPKNCALITEKFFLRTNFAPRSIYQNLIKWNEKLKSQSCLKKQKAKL